MNEQAQLYSPGVDAHAHIFTRDMPLIKNPRHQPDYSFTVADYLAQLDAHGVNFGVIAAASPWGDFNDYTIECVRASDRLKGTVILHPEKNYDLAFMKSCGIVGVRLPFIGLATLPDITTPTWQGLFQRIADLDWHIHLHVESRHIPDLLPVLERAGPKLVIDHLGRPGEDEGCDSPAFSTIAQSVARGNTWIKVSCGYRIGPVADLHLLAYLERVDTSRLFWASDCPFVGHEHQVSYTDTINWLAERVTDNGLRELLFSTNARDFYFNSPVPG